MIARAAAGPPSVVSADTAFGTTLRILSSEVDADHPVEARDMILAAADRRRSDPAISFASTIPCGPVQALAQPLLVTIALARPWLAAR